MTLLRSSNKIPESRKRNCGVYLIVHQKNHPGKLSLCIGMPVMISTMRPQSAVWQMVQKAVVWAGNHISLLRQRNTRYIVCEAGERENIQTWWFAWKCGSHLQACNVCILEIAKMTVFVRVSREQVQWLPICNDWLCIQGKDKALQCGWYEQLQDQLHQCNKFLQGGPSLDEIHWLKLIPAIVHINHIVRPCPSWDA